MSYIGGDGIIISGGITAKSVIKNNSGINFIPSPNYCYSDSLGTVPCAIGDMVAVMKCSMGSGKTSFQTTESLRPILRKSDVGYYLDCSGGRYMETDCNAGGDTLFNMVVAGKTSSSSACIAGCVTASEGVRSYIGNNDTGFIGAGVGDVSWTTLADTKAFTNLHIVSLVRLNNQATLYVDKVLADSSGVSAIGSSVNAFIGAVNNNGDATSFWNGDFYGFIGIVGSISNFDRLLIEDYLIRLCATFNPEGALVDSSGNYILDTSGNYIITTEV